MPTQSPKPANRRTLPQARASAPGYEIAFPKKPRAVSAVKGLFGYLRDAWGRGGEIAGDAYAASARVVLERQEALADLAAERRHRSSGATAGSPEPRRRIDAPKIGT